MLELLNTKFHIPFLSPQHVFRPRLMASLDECLLHPITLLSTPPGFGKTTVLAEWLDSQKHSSTTDFSISWLTLDENDDSPAIFWEYFISSLQQSGCEAGGNTLTLLQSPEVPTRTILLHALLNELATLQQQWVIILDDYHLIQNTAIHTDLTFLIDNLPETLHLILTSRMDPPLPIARWRARGRLHEVRVNDLRFTFDEAKEFLQHTIPASLSPEDISRLETRTEGWITGLQLAAISLRQQEDPHEFIQEFSGSHRYVIDYLVEEVLARQPEELLTFMLQTCILDLMCGNLCDAVMESTGGQEMLERLEKSNLFVFPMDGNRRWYRYHRLFADLLRKRLTHSTNINPAELHLRAAKWLEQEGFLAGAVTHALIADDPERATVWVERHAPTLLARGEMQMLRTILGKFNPETVRKHPWLSAYQALVFSLGDQQTQANDLLNVFADDPEPTLQAFASAIRAYDFFRKGQIPTAKAHARHALDRLPEDEVLLRYFAHFILGMSALLEDDLSGAESMLQTTFQLARQGGNLHIAMPAARICAQLQIDKGNLTEGFRICQDAISLATDAQGRFFPVASEACGRMGLVYYERNQLKEAQHYYTQAVQLAESWGNIDAQIGNLIRLKCLLHAQGDQAGWKDVNLKLEKHTAQAPQAQSDFVQLYQVRSWLSEGCLAEASLWASQLPESPSKEKAPYLNRTYEALACVRLAESNPVGAQEALNPITQWAEHHGLFGRLITYRILEALSFWIQGRKPESGDALQKAISYAQPEGWIRPFLDEGVILKPLLSYYLSHPPSTGNRSSVTYASMLLKAFDQKPHPSRPDHPAIPETPSPITEREHEILCLIAEGCTNQAIAERLVITIGTVKAHTASIYRKLDVGTRTQAIAKARSLKLL